MLSRNWQGVPKINIKEDVMETIKKQLQKILSQQKPLSLEAAQRICQNTLEYFQQKRGIKNDRRRKS